MCKLPIAENGLLFAPATVVIPAYNLLAPALRENKCFQDLKPLVGNVSFRVDTGADVTCLSTLDAKKIGIDTCYLEKADSVIGVGGYM